MLYYDKIDMRGRIDIAKSNSKKECMIWHYWFFNHDLTMLSVDISDIAIITIKNIDCCCIIQQLIY